MNWFSSPVCGIPYCTLPQGSLVTGRKLVASFTAAALNVFLGIWLFVYGTPVIGSFSWIAFPFDWQRADVMALKSPFSAAGVGTRLVMVGGWERLRKPW